MHAKVLQLSSHSHLKDAHYDCIIVGGGLVGASLALSLRHTGLKIALIEAKVPTRDDPRLLALNASSSQFLKHINVWNSVSSCATPIHDVHVSYKGHFGAVRLRREDLHADALGYVIPAYELEEALYQLLSLSGIQFYHPMTVAEIAADDASVKVSARSNQESINLHAKLLIGADGTHSTIRNLLDCPTTVKDYHQTAIVTRTQLQRSHHYIAYERFLTDGVLAMLPLTKDQCATIFTVNSAQAEEILNLSDQSFLDLLQNKFGYRLGKFKSMGKRYSYPLKMMNAGDMEKPNVILLGNAAHTLSPIAAQGFNLALFEVALLAEQMIANGTSIDFSVLREQFQLQQVFSKKLSDQLSRMFSQPSIFKSMLLPLGMVSFDLMPAVKKNFLNKIMGRNMMFPKLLVGVTK